jgi:hypothetical protein
MPASRGLPQHMGPHHDLFRPMANVTGWLAARSIVETMPVATATTLVERV